MKLSTKMMMYHLAIMLVYGRNIRIVKPYNTKPLSRFVIAVLLSMSCRYRYSNNMFTY